MIALLLIPLYALADRFAGGGWPALDAKLPGRAAFWGALVCAGLGYLVAGLLGPLAAVAWLIYRTPPWRIFGGSTTPRPGEIVGTFGRHLIAAPGLALAAYWSGHSPVTAALAGAGFAAIALALACWYAARIDRMVSRGITTGDPNQFVELIRGAAYGAAVALASFA